MLRPNYPILRSSSVGREENPFVSSMARRPSSTSSNSSLSSSGSSRESSPRARRHTLPRFERDIKSSSSFSSSSSSQKMAMIFGAFLVVMLAVHGGTFSIRTWRLWMENQALTQRLETISAKSEPLKALLDRLVAETPPGDIGRIELAHWKPSAVFLRDEFAPPPDASLLQRTQHWIRTRKKAQRQRRRELEKQRKKARKKLEKERKKKGKKAPLFSFPSFSLPSLPFEWMFRRPEPKHRKYKPPPSDICLVTKGTLDDLETHFLTAAKHWGGGATPSPVSVAVVIKLQRQLPFPSGDRRHPADRLAHFVAGHEAELEHVAIHLLLEYEAPSEASGAAEGSDKASGQWLANLAIDHAATDFVLFADSMGAIPAPFHTHDRLKGTLFRKAVSDGAGLLADRLRDERRILVVPAFDVLRPPVQVPKSKPDLRSLAEQGLVMPSGAPFRQASLLLEDWMWGLPDDPMVQYPVNPKAPAPDDAFEDHLLYETPFEPGFCPLAVILYRPGTPALQPLFSLGGSSDGDLESWFMELHRAGFRFSTLAQYFVALGKGPEPQEPVIAPSRATWREDGIAAFLDYLDDRYPLAAAPAANATTTMQEDGEEVPTGSGGARGSPGAEEGLFSQPIDERFFYTFRKHGTDSQFDLKEVEDTDDPDSDHDPDADHDPDSEPCHGGPDDTPGEHAGDSLACRVVPT